MRSFSWNKVRYRADRPIGELIDNLQKARQRCPPSLFFPDGERDLLRLLTVDNINRRSSTSTTT